MVPPYESQKLVQFILYKKFEIRASVCHSFNPRRGSPKPGSDPRHDFYKKKKNSYTIKCYETF